MTDPLTDAIAGVLEEVQRAKGYVADPCWWDEAEAVAALFEQVASLADVLPGCRCFSCQVARNGPLYRLKPQVPGAAQ